MKYCLSLIVLLTAISFIQAQEPPKSVPEEFKSLLRFEERTIDLGAVADGAVVSDTFRFENVSDEDVTIEFISVCDCTEVSYPKDAIEPGDGGEIPFTFDSGNRKDDNDIVIDIMLTNVEPTTGYQVVEQVFYTFEVSD